MYIPYEEKFIQGSLLITNFRFEFIWLRQEYEGKKLNINEILKYKLNPSMFNIAMVPIFNFYKVDEKKGSNGFLDIKLRSKGAQSCHLRDVPANNCIYKIQNGNVTKYQIQIEMSLSQSFSSPNSTLYSVLSSTIENVTNSIENISNSIENNTLFAFLLRINNDFIVSKHQKNIDKISKESLLSLSNRSLSISSNKESQLNYPEIAFPCLDISFGIPTNRIRSFPVFSKEEIENGYSIYNPIQEFMRQGAIQTKNEKWRISNVNKLYSICESYPSILCVPRYVTDNTLAEGAQFRSKGRIPVLTWLNPNGTPITRSAQPFTGFTFMSSSIEDEQIISEIQKTTNSNSLIIIDARPKANALGNALLGKGYENTSRYPNAQIEFMGIDNIHAMSSSLTNIQQLFKFQNHETSTQTFENSGWIKHTILILKSANRIIELVEDKKIPVLVRCSDGWDRTSQLTSLSSLCMDPFYRTIKGFELLIEKDWISFGHKFKDRICSGTEQSPIFFQFLDCVYQIAQQFPNDFEFNDNFLHCIADHIYSGLFGTFLTNNEKERESREFMIKDKTISLWTYMNHESIQPLFLNSLYKKNNNIVLRPKYDSITIYRNFWYSYFTQKESYKEKTMDLLNNEQRKVKQLEEKNQELNEKYEKEKQKNELLIGDKSSLQKDSTIEEESNCETLYEDKSVCIIPYINELKIIENFL